MTSLKKDGKCCGYESWPLYVYSFDDSQNKFPPIRVLVLVLSFLFYLVDIGLDIWLACEHYMAAQAGDELSSYYFQATLFFIVVPVFMVNLLSWGLYAWGWLVLRISKIKSYCTSHLVPVHDFHIIRWPWYLRKSKSKMSLTKTPPSSLTRVRNKQEVNVELATLNPTLDSSVEMENVGLGFRTHSRKDSAIPILSAEDLPVTEEIDTHLEFYPLDFFDNIEFLAVTIIHILQLGYAFRVIRLLYKRKQDKYSFDRYRDLSFLRLMEAFLESAPQFVLQLYIATIKTETRLAYNVITPISLIVSVCSLALAVGDYVSAAKDLNYYDPPPNHERKPRLSWCGYFMIIFWHMCMISGRGVALALFTSIFGRYLFLIVGIHYFIMVYWIYWQHAYVFIKTPEDYYLGYWQRGKRGISVRQKQPKTFYEFRSLRSCLDPRNHICRNYGIEFIVAAFNLFFHFKIKEGSSVETLVPFYVITFVENTLMIFLWYFSRDFELQLWYLTVAPVMVFLTFFVGLSFVVVYYYKFQPSKTLEPVPGLEHPTMTCTLNRLYTDKEKRGNIFQRMFRTFSRDN